MQDYSTPESCEGIKTATSVTRCKPSLPGPYFDHSQPSKLKTYTDRIGDNWNDVSREWIVEHDTKCAEDDFVLVRNGDNLEIRSAKGAVNPLGRVYSICWFTKLGIER